MRKARNECEAQGSHGEIGVQRPLTGKGDRATDVKSKVKIRNKFREFDAEVVNYLIEASRIMV